MTEQKNTCGAKFSVNDSLERGNKSRKTEGKRQKKVKEKRSRSRKNGK